MIAFLTDWGNSHYVGICKGVIRQITNDEVIDITHNITPFNVREAMYILDRTMIHFPEGTVFLAVVDHGVGSFRKAIAAKTEKFFFVGPDNGIFTLVFEHQPPIEIRELNNKKYHYLSSNTFHGRDIFSPAAAYISKGMFEELGDLLPNYATIPYIKPKKSENVLKGEVAYIDRFGNIETNIPYEWVNNKEYVKLRVRRKLIKIPVTNFYAEIGKGELLVHNDSTDYIEIAANQASAYEKLKLTPGSLLEMII
ncbi:SAM-dependent chlorinase/fluorinase [Thermosipho ferrireducens]|uniref:SAM-dependent chlorinase/fluorinase n=1 Tax=Thermosipho ferrireducens TaxID=2571116 RepID=A0ABX7S8K9_9BACT|nr:SAM-dependent chlorinase/fluorinase [Thermosipho ferrireducens]QTA37952.1 SAM-dependent chlorinase/fluorinase [Thermosipho ferrireducens]